MTELQNLASQVLVQWEFQENFSVTVKLKIVPSSINSAELLH